VHAPEGAVPSESPRRLDTMSQSWLSAARTACLAAASAVALAIPALSGAAGESPYAQYLEKVTTDEYNLDVKAGMKSTPKRGGKFRMRTKVDYGVLNPLLTSTQPDMQLINHLSDGLIDLDYETYELYPSIAWTWKEADILKARDGAPVYGRIRSQTADSVEFVPEAFIQTVSRFDVEKFDKDSVTLKASRGGATIRGTVTEFPTTLQVDTVTAPDAKAAVTYRIADLDQWKDDLSGEARMRPFLKPHCYFEFHVRDGVKWHDGQPFTAQDVIFTYDTINNENVDAARIRQMYQFIEKASVTEDGKGVVVWYGRPHYAAAQSLGFIGGSRYLIPRHIFNPEQYGGDAKAFGEAFNKHPFKDFPILCGPYRLKKWDKANRLTIERFNDYWASGQPDGTRHQFAPQMPYFDEISVVVIGDNNAAVRELEKEAIDADLEVEPDVWAQPSTSTPEFVAKMTRAERLGFLYTYIGWNLERPVFKDADTRRALAMLIPRERIAKEIYQGLAQPVTGPAYLKGPAYDKTVEQIPYDVAAAKRLLRRAGWADRDGDGILEKTIDGVETPFRFSYMIHNAKDYHQKIADIIKESMAEAGIQITIDKLDWNLFSDKTRDKEFDAVRFAWGNSLDPDFFPIWHSSQIKDRGDNFISYRNPRVDEITVAAREEFDAGKRWEMNRELHRILAQEQPVCFLDAFIETYFINRKIHGVRLYPSDYPHNWSEWYWAGDAPASAGR
jgi:ABC-type transport system substrate-binding protein